MLLLTLSAILASSPASGMIFSFIPGGNSIRNVIRPILNTFNTTDDDGNPTFGGNVVRVVDPILAMQFARGDLVSSPEDYLRSAYPHYPTSRNSFDPGLIADPRLVYPYYAVPGGPSSESQVADLTQSGPTSPYLGGFRDSTSNTGPPVVSQGLPVPLFVAPQAGPDRAADGRIQNFNILTDPYHVAVQNPLESSYFNDLQRAESFKNLPYNLALQSPIDFNHLGNFRQAEGNQRIPYPYNLALQSPFDVNDAQQTEDYQQVPYSYNQAARNAMAPGPVSDDPRAAEFYLQLPYPDNLAQRSPIESARLSDPREAEDYQQLPYPYNLALQNPISHRWSDPRQVEHYQRLQHPHDPTLRNSIELGRMSGPGQTEDLQQLPYLLNLALRNSLESDHLSDPRQTDYDQQLQYAYNPALRNFIDLDHVSDPRQTEDFQKLPYSINLALPNSVESGGVRDLRQTQYHQQLPVPYNLASRTPYGPVSDPRLTENYSQLPQPYSTALGSPAEFNRVSDPSLSESDQKLVNPYNLKAPSPFETGQVTSPKYAASSQISPNPLNFAPRSSPASDQVSGPRHFGPIVNPDLLSPWVDFPNLTPLPLRDPFMPGHFHHQRQLHPGLFGDNFIPNDHYLNDYVYGDDYPIIERFSPDHLFHPDPYISSPRLGSSAPQVAETPSTSRSANEPSSPTQNSELDALLDKIPAPFRPLIERLTREGIGANEIEKLPPIYRSLLNAFLSGGLRQNPSAKANLPGSNLVSAPLSPGNVRSNLRPNIPILGETPGSAGRGAVRTPTDDAYHIKLDPLSPYGPGLNFRLGDTGAQLFQNEGLGGSPNYAPSPSGYSPFVNDPSLGCFDWMNPKGKIMEDMFSLPNPLAKSPSGFDLINKLFGLGNGAQNNFGQQPLPNFIAAPPVQTPPTANNINYGIIEPNYGNYPIYSFDNKNPIQNFNHQTNPILNPVQPPAKPSSRKPSLWPFLGQKQPLIVSPFQHPLFTPTQNTVPEYPDEGTRYWDDFPDQEPASEISKPSDFNPEGIRVNWPKDPTDLKSMFNEGKDAPPRPDFPMVSQGQPGQLPALVIVSDQPQNQGKDPNLNTINATKNFNLLPIQLPASFLNNLLNNGLFSAILNNLPGTDPVTSAGAPRGFTTLNPKKHNIQLYNPYLRGFHGGINPFTRHHKGAGYKGF